MDNIDKTSACVWGLIFAWGLFICGLGTIALLKLYAFIVSTLPGW
jgi:hypothetical protein